MPGRLQVHTLGGLTVTCDGQPVSGFASRKVPALLVYLAATGRSHPRELLAELFWEERDQAQSLSNLRVALTGLRQTVGDYVAISREAVGLAEGAEWWLDTVEFERLLAAGDSASLADAVALYRGDFLAGFYVDSQGFEEWAGRERERLRLRLMEALDALISGHISQGDYAAGIACATRLLELDPLREETHRQYMTLLALSDQRGKALEQYATCRRLLAEELGVEPMPETQALYERLRAGTPLAPASPAVPAIRGYELRERIGAGGFGEVYRAYQPTVDREVAIKVILPQYANHPDFIRRFEREAQLVARLEHPHIVPLYDYWREPDKAYLVMRYLRGGSLSQMIKVGPVSPERVAALLDQVAAGLEVAHRRGVVHRDLKPANILLDEQGNAYLSDFGIAKDLRQDGEATQAEAVIGAPAYISPEQVRGEVVTPQADIYGLGVVLYELLTGEQPFPHTSSPEVLLKHLSEPLPALGSKRPDLPPALDGIIQRATAKDRAARYSDALSLAAAFRAALAGTADAVADTPASHGAADLAILAVQNPYKGLRAFQEADASDFFGREALVEQLLARLAEEGEFSHFLAVVGPSGSGKSSVVRAGLLPALRRGALPGADRWFTAEMFPGGYPFEELEVALSRIAVSPPANLAQQLREDERGLLRAVKQLLPPDEDTELLLVIDQFEELFTLVADEATRVHFLHSLRLALGDPRGRLRVVLTLRADFYDRPLLYPEFGEWVRQRTEVVLPLSPAELEQAVTAPARRVGVAVQPRLVEAILSDVREQPGALPLLQYALTELFEQRQDHSLTLAAYQALGGVHGALAKRADAVYAGLDAASKDTARQVFLRLVTLGEGVEDTRRRTLQSELLALGDAPTIQQVLDAFGTPRLLTFDRDPLTRGPTVEVAHEALLREWSQLRGWLNESRDDVRLQRLLATASAEWQRAGQERDYLLSGSRLAQFGEWATGASILLTHEERAFLDASLVEERRRRTLLRRVRYGAFALTALVAMLMSLLALLAFDREGQANQAREEAQELALVNGARAAFANDDLDTALALAVEANRVITPSAQAQLVLSEVAYPPGTIALFLGHSGEVMTIDVSADGRLALSGDELGLVIVWDLATGEAVHYLEGHEGAIQQVGIHPNGRSGFSIAEDRTIILWNLETGEMLNRFGDDLILSPDALSAAFSPDGNTILSNNGGRSLLQEFAEDQEANLILWDVHSGAPLRVFRGHTAVVGRIAVSPDGQTALSGAWGGELILWDMATGEVIQRFGELSQQLFKLPSDIAFRPDGRSALIRYADGSSMLWDLTTFETLGRYGEEGGFTWLETALSPDGRFALLPNLEGIALVDVNTGATVTSFPEYGFIGASYLPDGNHVLIGNIGELRLLALQHGAELQRYETPLPTTRLALSPDGQTLLTAYDSGFQAEGQRQCGVILFDVRSGDEIQAFRSSDRLIQELGCPVQSAAYRPDGLSVLSGTNDGRAILWDASTGDVLLALPVHPVTWTVAAFSPDGRTVLTGSDSGQISLWNLDTGEELHQLAGHSGPIWQATFSPDGLTALSSSQDGLVIHWDIDTGEEIQRFEGHIGGANDVEYSPDGAFALSGDDGGQLILWNLATGQPETTIVADQINNVSFALNGQFALTSGDSVSLWDLSTGAKVRHFASQWMSSLLVFPDDQSFLVLGPNGHSHRWRIDWGEALFAWTLQNRYIRDLTCIEREQYRIEPLCAAAE